MNWLLFIINYIKFQQHEDYFGCFCLCALRLVELFAILPCSAKLALKVFPGLIPIFSVLKSYSPCLIFSLIKDALSVNTASTP